MVKNNILYIMFNFMVGILILIKNNQLKLYLS